MADRSLVNIELTLPYDKTLNNEKQLPEKHKPTTPFCYEYSVEEGSASRGMQEHSTRF